MERQRAQRIRDNEQRQNVRRKRLRAAGLELARWILEDARRWDKKHGFVCNLSRKEITELVTQPCTYCTETTIRMTLDRKDNTQGHVRDNVVPACIRCNYVRRNMPYEAWLLVAVGMRSAVEAKLFGAWTGRARTSQPT